MYLMMSLDTEITEWLETRLTETNFGYGVVRVGGAHVVGAAVVSHGGGGWLVILFLGLYLYYLLDIMVF
jgi:hypothetical protein